MNSYPSASSATVLSALRAPVTSAAPTEPARAASVIFLPIASPSGEALRDPTHTLFTLSLMRPSRGSQRAVGTGLHSGCRVCTLRAIFLAFASPDVFRCTRAGNKHNSREISVQPGRNFGQGREV